MVPNGFDLFHKPWPPEAFRGEVKLHPLYQDFIKKAVEAGFAVDSQGFTESERTYFMFYLMGANATLV